MNHHLPPGLHKFTIEHANRPRRYLLQVPPAVARQTALPLMLALHGTGSTAAWMRTETRLGEFAATVGLLVAFPEGLPPRPEQPPRFRTNPPFWHDRPENDPLDDVGFLTAALDDVADRTSVDPRRIFVTGFSNGASMTFRFAAERSARLAAIAPVAGPCSLRAPHLERAVPTLFLVGEADPLVPLDGGPIAIPWGGTVVRAPITETLTTWATALGCPPVREDVRTSDGVREETFGPGRDGVELISCTIAGLGHHWPGGLGQLNPRIAGPKSSRLDANARIWEFFQRWRS